jgi:hypothetical protein
MDVRENSFVSGNSNVGKSFQSFTVSEELLAKVTEAVMAGEKQARSSGTIQSFEVFYRGFRQNIAIGRIYVIPASVCTDRKDFPTALLYGCLVREFGGEELGDMIEKRIGESEFDEYSQADFDTIKKKLFGTGEGKFESLILFAPSWWNSREYITFKFTKDEAQLKNCLRHQVFSVYYDPRLSSAFNAIMTNANTTKVDVTDITPKLNFPFLAENLLTQYPDLQKQASNRKKIFLTRRTADAVTKEVLDPEELNVFDSLDQALTEALLPGTESVEDASEEHHNEGEVKVPRVAAEKTADGKSDTYWGKWQEAEDLDNAAKGTPADPFGKDWVDAEGLARGEKTAAAFGGKQAPPFGSEKDEETDKTADDKSDKYWGKWQEAEDLNESDKGTPIDPFGKDWVDAEALSKSADEKSDKYWGKWQEAEDLDEVDKGTPVDPFGKDWVDAEALAKSAQVEPAEENVELRAGEFPVGIAIDENGVPRNKAEEEAGKSKEACDDPEHEQQQQQSNPLQEAAGGMADAALEMLPELLASKDAALAKNRKAKHQTFDHPEIKPSVARGDLSTSYSKAFNGGFYDKHAMPPQDVRDYLNKTTGLDAQAHHATLDHAKEIDAGKWGPTPTLKSAAQQIKADFIAEHIAADFEKGYEAMSPKTRKAREERETRLAKNRHKQADVALDIDSIWDEITEDMGPAPIVSLGGGDGDKSESKGSDGRPRKSDIGKRPEAIEEPEESESESDDKPWQVSSSMEEFVKEAFEESELDEPKYGCDQCEMLAINGVPTHELGCPNGKKTWVPGRGWVRYNECECGADVAEGEEHECELYDEGGSGIEEEEPDPEVEDKQAAVQEEYQCANCDQTGSLDQHGRCGNCGSDAVISVNKIGEPLPLEQPVAPVPKKPKFDPAMEYKEPQQDEEMLFVGSKKADKETTPTYMPADAADSAAPCPKCGQPIGTGEFTTNEGYGGAEQHLNCPAAQGYKPSEKAQNLSAPTRDLGPEFQAAQMTHEMERNKAILRNPSATPQEKGIAQQRLDEGMKRSSKKKKADTADNPYNWVDGNGAPEDKKNAEKPMTSVADTKRSSKKKADSVQPDMAEAKSQTVSVDTVDSTIQQPTESVEEAAKVAAEPGNPMEGEPGDSLPEICSKCHAREGDQCQCETKTSSDVSGEMAEAKAQTVSPDSVDSDIQQPTESVEEAAKVAADSQAQCGHEATGCSECENCPKCCTCDEKGKTAELGAAEHEEDAVNGICPRCGKDDTETFNVEEDERKRLYCHNCDQVTWTFGLGKAAAAGDNLPEEIPITLGDGDLADVVMSEDTPDGE